MTLKGQGRDPKVFCNGKWARGAGVRQAGGVASALRAPAEMAPYERFF